MSVLLCGFVGFGGGVMERLTEKIEKYIEAYQLPPFGREVVGTVELLQEVSNKLAEYENFEEIFREKMTDMACEFLKDKEEFSKWLDRNKWFVVKCDEYARAEEQGLLLRLPCNVGDTVYVPHRGKIQEMIIQMVSWNGTSFFFSWTLNSGIYPWLDGFGDMNIGKTVFLTQEQAEEKLKEMAGD